MSRTNYTKRRSNRGPTMAKPTGDDLVKMASSMAGKPYIFGYEVRLSDPNPKAFDCSELIEWACYRLGVYFPDGSNSGCR